MAVGWNWVGRWLGGNWVGGWVGGLHNAAAGTQQEGAPCDIDESAKRATYARMGRECGQREPEFLAVSAAIQKEIWCSPNAWPGC